MKTTGLSFTEALQMVLDGKAEGFKRSDWTMYLVADDYLLKWNDGLRFTPSFTTLLANNFELVNAKKEKKIVKGWANLYRRGLDSSKYTFGSVVLYETKEAALSLRLDDALGEPVYIEHEYEVDP